jgi:hypothetical protein
MGFISANATTHGFNAGCLFLFGVQRVKSCRDTPRAGKAGTVKLKGFTIGTPCMGDMIFQSDIASWTGLLCSFNTNKLVEEGAYMYGAPATQA